MQNVIINGVTCEAVIRPRNKFRNLCRVAFLASVASSVWSQTALAQATGGEQRPASGSSAKAEEIVVTAQLRSQTLQSVPAAVTAIGGGQLVGNGATTLSQLSQLSPGLAISPLRTQSFIFMRGVGQTLSTANADPAVAVNVNGVYVPKELSGASFYDIDRVEVVFGPQGTLYGQNSTGGVINLLTRRPGDVLASNGFIEVGNYGRLQTFVGVDTPVSDKLAFRTAVTLVRHNGYVNNGVDDQDTFGVRATGVWRPTDTTTVTGIIGYVHDGGIGPVPQNVPPQNGDYRKMNFDPKALGYNIDYGNTQASLEINQHLSDNLTLTYLGGYNRLNASQQSAQYYGPPLVPTYVVIGQRFITQELRANWSSDNLDAVGGLYYFNSRSPYAVVQRSSATRETLNGPFVARSHGAAAFGQLTYSLMSDFRLTAGARISSIRKSLSGSNGTRVNGVVATQVPYQGKYSLDRADWKLGLEYDLGSKSLFYANVGTGFTPGGLSAAPAQLGSDTAQPFAPVKLLAYSGGIKSRFFGDHLTLNGELFYYNYKNFQVSARNPQTLQNIVYNAEKSEIYGAQVDALVRFSRFAELSAGITQLHAKFVDLVTPAGDFAGQDMPYSPKTTLHVGYRHRIPLRSGGEIEASVESQYVSSQASVYTHAAGTDISSYTNTNVNLTYRTPDGHWSAAVWVRNIEDELVKTVCIGGNTPGPAACNFTAPRTFGVRLGFDF